MKKFKKIFAAIAASALVAAMSFTSMAASITINSGAPADGIDTTTYTYYQMLKASISGENVAYYVEGEDSTYADEISKLKADLDGVGEEDALFTVSEKTVAGNRWNVTPSANLTTLIQSGEVGKAEAANKIAAAFKTLIDKDLVTGKNFTSKKGKAEATNLDPGYYLVESSLGTVLAVDTVGDVRITEKNAYPRDAKKVAERSVITGRNITYYITVDVPASVIDTETITVHDTFEDKFSFDKMSVQVHTENTKDASDPSSTGINVDTAVDELAKKSYTGWEYVDGFQLVTEGLGDDCTFEMTISQLNKYKNKSIVIKYTAQLDDVEADNDYFNREYLTYTNYTSKEKEAPVKTYDFNLVKTFSDSDGVEGLNADFNLYEDTDSDGALNLQKDLAMKLFLDETGYIVSNRQGANSTITANKGTKLNIRGLGEGTYYLVETRTSDGYNLLATAVQINIDAEGKVTLAEGTVGDDDTITVNNEKGIRLPSTGGMGTVAFAVVGLIVMAGAAVTLIIKKRA